MVLVYAEVGLLCASEESLKVMGKIDLKPDHSEAQTMGIFHIDGLVADCSNSSASVIELQQSCTKLSILCNYLIKQKIFNEMHTHRICI